MSRARSVVPQDPGVLDRSDYLDAIEAAGPGRTAEERARAVFEGAPGVVQLVLRWGWRWGLQLRIGPYPAPDRVLGWPVLDNDPGRLVLGVRSSLLGTCRLVFQVEDERLLLTTVIRYETPVARPLWTVVSPVHRIVTRMLAARAVTRAGRSR